MRRSTTLLLILSAGSLCQLAGCNSGPFASGHKLVARPPQPAGETTDTRFTNNAWTRGAEGGANAAYQPVGTQTGTLAAGDIFSNTPRSNSSAPSGTNPVQTAAFNTPEGNGAGAPTPMGILSDLPGLGMTNRSQSMDGPMPENASRVSFASEGADFDPTVAGDGRRIFFSSTRHSQNSDIYVQSIGGTAVTQLTTDPAHDVMPGLSPDGQRIAFASNRGGSWDIFMMNSSGGQAVQITFDNGHELHPTWSPDGTKIAYCRLGENSDRWEIWLRDLNSPAKATFLTYGLFPEWHPTQNRILFQRPRERGSRFFSVWTIDYLNGEAVNPTEIASSSVAAIINPTWSLDGEHVAFATIMDPPADQGNTRPKNADIWFARSDGSGKTNLTRGHAINLMPAWGPDGTVFFISDRSGQDNIWSIRPEQAIQTASIMGGGSSDLADVPVDEGN